MTSERPAPGALDSALRYLGPAARSRTEMERHLRTKGYPPEEAEAALVRLAELGLLDDLQLAVDAAEQAARVRGDSPAKVREALLARGVDRAAVESALEQAWPEGQQSAALAQALDVGTRRLRVLHGDASSVRRRLAAYLGRRGYDYDVVNQVCRQLVPFGSVGIAD